MGEECGASSPFLFFCDFDAELAAAVAEGRREEFARFARFRDPAARAAIPDPNDGATFDAAGSLGGARARAAPAPPCAVPRLLELRQEAIVPRLPGMTSGGRYAVDGTVVSVAWPLGDGALLGLVANLGRPSPRLPLPRGETLSASGAPGARARGVLPPGAWWWPGGRDG